MCGLFYRAKRFTQSSWLWEELDLSDPLQPQVQALFLLNAKMSLLQLITDLLLYAEREHTPYQTSFLTETVARKTVTMAEKDSFLYNFISLHDFPPPAFLLRIKSVLGD